MAGSAQKVGRNVCLEDMRRPLRRLEVAPRQLSLFGPGA